MPDINKFGKLIAGRSLDNPTGPVCPVCNSGGGYLVGEPGHERHVKCWEDGRATKGKRRRRS